MGFRGIITSLSPSVKSDAGCARPSSYCSEIRGVLRPHFGDDCVNLTHAHLVGAMALGIRRHPLQGFGRGRSELLEELLTPLFLACSSERVRFVLTEPARP